MLEKNSLQQSQARNPSYYIPYSTQAIGVELQNLKGFSTVE